MSELDDLAFGDGVATPTNVSHGENSTPNPTQTLTPTADNIPIPQVTSHPTRTEPTTDTEHHRHILNELIDLGADLARLLHQQAHEAAKTPPQASNRTPPQDLTAAFDRVVRTVRRTILLARSLDAPPRPQPAAPTRTATRKHILRAVEDALHSRGTDPARAETLHAEMLDRLDSPEFVEDLATRPIPELITEICNDLGITAMPGFSPVKRRTPADLALLHARATAPTRPAAPWPPPRGEPKRL